MIKHFDSLVDLMDDFPDEQSCIDHLRSIRWRNGEFCPLCGCNRIMHFSDKKTFKCSDCRQRFSIKVGTIFQDTKLPLRKWFMAIWLITNHPKGIASTMLAKDLSITQKSAWFVLHRLRHAARTQSFAAPLDGQVEADTTFVGGKEKNKHASKKTPGSQGANKAVVLGTIQRDGALRTEHGIPQWVSDKHLSRHIAETMWRYNRREMNSTGRMNAISECVEGPMPYKVLTA